MGLKKITTTWRSEMSAPSKAYCLLMVEVHLGQRLATSPTPILTFREVTT